MIHFIAIRRNSTVIIRRGFRSVVSKVSTDSTNTIGTVCGFRRYTVPPLCWDQQRQPAPREFSTARVGSITRELRKLDPAVVGKIEEELRRVDKDCDGRVDAEDLANLLKTHRPSTLFTDAEILEFSELFYAGKAGASVRVSDVIETLDKVAAADRDTATHPHHPMILDGNCSTEYLYRKSHDYSHTPQDLDIELTHQPPQTFSDRAAFSTVRLVRGVFDTATGWSNDTIQTQNQILNRVIFLETVAAVPGMVAAVARHFRSLRKMERDGGLLHLFLEEANNERMHLLSFVQLKDPGMFFRGAVVASQFGFATAFFLAYMVSPKFCHRFVGYIEEEACHTYTNILEAVETSPPGSELEAWKTQTAPAIARAYWKLGDTGTVLDLLYAVRADEAEHRDVHHACGNLPSLFRDGNGGKNHHQNHHHSNHNGNDPFPDPDTKVHDLLRKYVEDMMSQTRSDSHGPGSGDTKLSSF